jgi:arsenite-transporting ATPase
MSDVTNLLEDSNLRFIFVGGKGGVGKTSTSSALASQLAFNRKVLLISTDPAHSLSDAFRMEFDGTPKQVPGIANLEVMEVNPTKFLKEELHEWAGLAESAGVDDLAGRIHEFQEWLSGVPGVDEATALSSVIDLIESGEYDTIVFDTAPTGHTLKLLQLPGIMQAGLAKLESWQSTIWNYWEMVKGQGQAVDVKKEVANRIRQYKHGIERVGKMLKDGKRTKFVVVCIAEYLSISESRRLLQELKRHEVSASNIVVNQLVRETLSDGELSEIKGLIGQTRPDLVQRISAVSALSNARNSIQRKYLGLLKNSDEAKGLRIVEVPLLPSEITGPAKLLEFSQYLIPKGYRQGELECPSPLLNREHRASLLYERSLDLGFVEGEKVELCNLNKSPHYNGKIGEVVKVTEDGRVVIRVKDPETGKYKVLSLKPDNLQVVPREKFL